MAHERRIAALITGLLVFGCATQPPTAPGGAPAPTGAAGDRKTTGYALQDEPIVTRVGVASAGASSTRNPEFFAPLNAVDGNTHSAWAPNVGDFDPSLTLELDGAHAVSGLKVKLSLGEASSPANARVTVTVSAVAPGGQATVIATGLTPAETELADLAIPTTTTGALRLSFDTGGSRDLRVCEVQVFEGQAASPTPSASPTGGPSPTPEPVAGVAVSSTRAGSWFAAGNAIDDNPNSAWGPAPDDPNPTMTVALEGAPTVTAVQLKLSLEGLLAQAEPGPVAVSVFAVLPDDTVVPIADVWRPAQGTLETLDVADTAATAIRFVFDTGGRSGLLVCDANVVTGPAASPTPEPSIEPTPTPSVEPSPSPTPFAVTFPLSGANEVPPRETDASGSITFTQSADGLSLDFDFTLTALENLTAAHIHLGGPGVNGGIVATLIADGAELDALTADDLVNELAGSTIADLVEMIEAGTVYVNVHTDDGVDPPNTGAGDFPGGELRGQIIP